MSPYEPPPTIDEPSRLTTPQKVDNASAKLLQESEAQVSLSRKTSVDSPQSDESTKLSKALIAFRTANQLVEQFKQLAVMPSSEIVSVRDSRGIESSLTVADLRVQLRNGIQAQYASAAQFAESIDLAPVRERSSKILAEFKEGKVSDRPYAAFELERSETILNAPKSIRLAYSHFLVDSAIDQMARQGELDPRTNAMLTMGRKLVEPFAVGQRSPVDPQIPRLIDTIARAQSGQLDDVLPAVLAEQAIAKARSGYLKEAREDISVAIERADKAAQRNPNGTALIADRFAAPGLSELPIALRMQNLRMLAENELWKDSESAIADILTRAPGLRKNPELRSLCEQVELRGQLVDPFLHLQELARAFEKKDMASADSALKKFEDVADEVNKGNRQQKKIAEIQTLLDGETDENLKSSLSKELALRKMLYQSPQIAEYFHARLALAAGNHDGAKALFRDLETKHSEFAGDPKLQIEELKKLCDEPKNKKDGWTRSANIVKELLCDVTAIGAGTTTVVLTGWSGPAALLAGSGAGALAYTGAKAALFGTDAITWTTPIWGAVDGLSGGTSALARQGITRFGGALVKREVAERAVVGVGGEVAPLMALEGFELSNAAVKSAKIGLNEMAKDVPWTLRMRSSIGIPGGSAEYSAALSSYRQLRNANFAMNFGKDCLSTGAGAFIYNTGRGVADYHAGRETDVKLLMSRVATNSFRDSLTGGLMGPIARQSGVVDGTVGRYLRLPELAEPTLGALSPHASELISDTDAMANAWIDYCRSRRTFTNQQIFDRYVVQLSGNKSTNQPAH